MDIKNAVILITSAGSLLGSTQAMHFASLGATVILCDQEIQALHNSYQKCLSITGRVHCFQLPNRSMNSIQQMYDAIYQQCNTCPDVLVNILPTQPFPRLISDSSTDVFSQNLTSMISAMFSFGRASAERMRKENKKGVIVNIISREGYDDLLGFESAASMVTGLTQSWAKELTPFHIRVGGVVPSLDAPNGVPHWGEVYHELIRNTEYIVTNDYFSGRVMAA
ncbi:SDR family oxidoreductase [Vibrio sp.]|uniref:SDR family oxidoreductase n=1 Tax=Vibrio sp. TaxID=678 RepID=UPI003D0CE2DB